MAGLRAAAVLVHGSSPPPCAGRSWPGYRDRVLLRLAPLPHEAVLFVLLTLKDVPQAWQLADDLDLQDDRVWDRLIRAHEGVDPAATLPVHARLVQAELEQTGALHYRRAARRLRRMHTLAERVDRTADVEQLVAEIREAHRRRPRLLQELDRAGL